MKRTPLARGTKTLKRSGFQNRARGAKQPLGAAQTTKPRKRTKAAAKRLKKGIWSTATADTYFSKWIRARDGKCLRCHTTEGLTCSHYHRRAISITRFCPINCITLCSRCHADWEGPKEGYTDFMVNMLGPAAYIELKRKSGRYMVRSEAVAECKLFLSLGKSANNAQSYLLE